MARCLLHIRSLNIVDLVDCFEGYGGQVLSVVTKSSKIHTVALLQEIRLEVLQISDVFSFHIF